MVLMRDEGVLQPILSELTGIERLRMLVLIEDETETRDAVRRLASLLPRDPASARAVAGRLKLSNADRDRLVALASPENTITPPLDERARRHALHRLGAPLFRDLVLLDWAYSQAAAKRHRELLAAADAWTPVSLPVKGQDAVDLGVSAGPEVGRLLAEVEKGWEEGDYRATREDCLTQLKTLIGARRTRG
jgi:poly(A) polymerase